MSERLRINAHRQRRRSASGEAEARKTLADFLREDLGAHRHPPRVRARRVRRVHRAPRRRAGALVPDARGAGAGRVDHHDRGAWPTATT